jgi:hypothetical protein
MIANYHEKGGVYMTKRPPEHHAFPECATYDQQATHVFRGHEVQYMSYNNAQQMQHDMYDFAANRKRIGSPPVSNAVQSNVFSSSLALLSALLSHYHIVLPILFLTDGLTKTNHSSPALKSVFLKTTNRSTSPLPFLSNHPPHLPTALSNSASPSPLTLSTRTCP